MPRDHKDLVIETLADSEAALFAQVTILEGALILLARTAVDLVVEHERLRQQHYRRRDEFQDFRERVMLEAVTA